jgi:tetratricopeptide (TPR) repeat protein
VRLYGLHSQETNHDGYFAITLTGEHGLKPGQDLHIGVDVEGMVILEPPDEVIRLPENPDTQVAYRIVLAKKRSLVLLRSERMLQFVFQKRLEAAIDANDKEAARQLELAKESARLGLSEEELTTAVESYKESLRTSPDLNKRGLAALDDANSATESEVRKEYLDKAETSFREARIKNLRTIVEGRKAEVLQPEIDFNLGLTFFEKAAYDSARIYFARADSLKPGKSETLNWLGRAHAELAQFSGALESYGKALATDTLAFGRNHPNVAIRLNNIAGVLRAKGDYDGALEKYNEALTIFESFLGPEHPNTNTVRANRDQVVWDSLSENQRWFLQTQYSLAQLNDSTVARSEPEDLALLNQIAVGYIKQNKGDSAVIYLDHALPLAQKLDDVEMTGTLLNNSGAAHKIAANWSTASDFLQQSVRHNTAILGGTVPLCWHTPIFIWAGSCMHKPKRIVPSITPGAAEPWRKNTVWKICWPISRGYSLS